MCFSASTSIAMVGIGATATVITVARGRRWPVPVTLGYFTVIEAMQAAGYAVVDECGNPLNQTVTLLSYIHIAFQPIVINAFAMELVPERNRSRAAAWVYGGSGLSAAIMLVQLYPMEWAGHCQQGSLLCGPELCLVSGEWHIAWSIPYNDMLAPLGHWLGMTVSFPTYAAMVFLAPLAYGAWRFVLFHLMAGPVAAYALTSDPNEFPAIWCLFSIGIVLIALIPPLARRVAVPGWEPWPGILRS